MNTFLPNEYKLPSSSNYLKLKDGENTFRVLSSAIIGYEYWNTENKPVRLRNAPKTIPDDIGLDKNGETKKIKHFWAFVVWSYDNNAIQILEITQSTIQGAIKALVDNKKWGTPKDYDITITRSGDGFDTEYQIMPNPHSKLDENIQKAYEEKSINLDKLYEGKNPFATE